MKENLTADSVLNLSLEHHIGNIVKESDCSLVVIGILDFKFLDKEMFTKLVTAYIRVKLKRASQVFGHRT